jgi:uncharacterized membrane protein
MVAVVTSRVPGSCVSQKTSKARRAIISRLAFPDGNPTVNIRLTYNPAVGKLGHIMASLFGADPKRQMDDGLMRRKSCIETRKVPSDAAWHV